MNPAIEMSHDEIVRRLKKKLFFASYDHDTISNFVRNSEPLQFEPHRRIWREQSGTKLDFMVLVDGCLAVWDKTFGEGTIDALIVPGQLVGEFELFGFLSKSYELHSLTHSLILRAKPDAIKSLLNATHRIKSRNETDKCIFYQNLCKTLIEKLRSQNKLLKFRTGDVDKRLARLLDNFTNDSGWRYLTDLKNKMSTETFTLNLYFTRRILFGLLATKLRSLGPVLHEWIGSKILQIKLFDENFNQTAIADASQFGEGLFPNSEYIEIKVLKHDQLINIID